MLDIVIMFSVFVFFLISGVSTQVVFTLIENVKQNKWIGKLKRGVVLTS